MRDLIVWLNETSGSIALRESLLLWPVIEAAHVLTIMLFVGTIIMVDLRLLGLIFRDVRVSEMTSRILPWTIAGFILMVITGVLLFYAKPLLYFHNIFFRAKLIILIVAMINILIFHRVVHRGVTAWDAGATPFPVRLSAGASLATWIGVIVLGRLIAYDWFNCEKLDPDDLVFQLNGCPVVTAAIFGE